MKKRLFRALFPFLAVGALVLLAPTTPTRAAPNSVVGPIAVEAAKPSVFNGDLRDLPSLPESDKPPFQSLTRNVARSLSAPEWPDGSVPSLLPAALMPKPNSSHTGIGFTDSCPGGYKNLCGSGWPPDPNGDIGLTHYVEMVNLAIGMFNKSTGAVLWRGTINQFWSGVNTGTPCNNSHMGDPVVLYDAQAGRWLISDFAFGYNPWTGQIYPPFYECVAISKGEDPVSSGWYYYAIHAGYSGPSSSDTFPDYPKIGVWPDSASNGYFITTNQFGPKGLIGSRVMALDRAAMLSGSALYSIYWQFTDGTGGILPAHLRGPLMPAGTDEYLAAIDSPNTSNKVHIWKVHYDPADPLNGSYLDDTPVDVSVIPFSEPCNSGKTRACIPQKGVTEKLDSLGDRLMMQLQYRNNGSTESLWATHTVANSTAVGSQTGIRWYQFDVTGGTIATTPVQQATFKPYDNVFRWMPSLAVDKYGNMAVGYSASGSQISPQIRYAGRLSSDPANTLARGEAIMVAGGGSQSGGYHRWGDYSAMTVDPADDCTFWYTNEYYTLTGKYWKTALGYFRFPACGTTGAELIQQDSPYVAYGGWTGEYDGAASGGSYRWSNTANDMIRWTFSGSSLKWIHPRGPKMGLASVTIDNKAKGTVDLYSAGWAEQVATTFANLSTLTAHTVVIKVLGQPSPSNLGGDTRVAFDAFVAGGKVGDDTSSAVRLDGWFNANNNRASNGSYIYSATLNDTVKLHVAGAASEIDWLTVKGPGFGKASVVVDGGAPVIIDLFASMVQYQARIKFPLAPLASHDIQVTVLHKKNGAATGFKVAVDAFDVVP